MVLKTKNQQKLSKADKTKKLKQSKKNKTMENGKLTADKKSTNTNKSAKITKSKIVKEKGVNKEANNVTKNKNIIYLVVTTLFVILMFFVVDWGVKNFINNDEPVKNYYTGEELNYNEETPSEIKWDISKIYKTDKDYEKDYDEVVKIENADLIITDELKEKIKKVYLYSELVYFDDENNIDKKNKFETVQRIRKSTLDDLDERKNVFNSYKGVVSPSLNVTIQEMQPYFDKYEKKHAEALKKYKSFDGTELSNTFLKMKPFGFGDAQGYDDIKDEFWNCHKVLGSEYMTKYIALVNSKQISNHCDICKTFDKYNIKTLPYIAVDNEYSSDVVSEFGRAMNNALCENEIPSDVASEISANVSLLLYNYSCYKKSSSLKNNIIYLGELLYRYYNNMVCYNDNKKIVKETYEYPELFLYGNLIFLDVIDNKDATIESFVKMLETNDTENIDNLLKTVNVNGQSAKSYTKVVDFYGKMVDEYCKYIDEYIDTNFKS